MSLAFLAKKSWHTTNISNQEKVWLKQQEQEREKKKLELLQKQMKEEREIEEMRQASGQARPTEKLTWMYSQPVNLTTDDEYLMGKEKEPEKEDEELKKVVTNQGVSQAFIEKQKDPARAWRDDMNKIRDDPLLAIKQAEKRQREKIMDNPLKISQFREELEKKRLAKEEKKAAKKAAKKEKKKEKKHGKGHRSDSSDDEAARRKSALSSAVDPSFIRGAAASSSREWDRNKDQESGKERRFDCDRSRDDSRDCNRSRDYRRDGRDGERDRGRDRDRSRDRKRDKEGGRRDGDGGDEPRRRSSTDRERERDRDRGGGRGEGRHRGNGDDRVERSSRWEDKSEGSSSKRARSPEGKRGDGEEGDGEDLKRAFPKSQVESKFGYGLWRGEGVDKEKQEEGKAYDPRAVKVQKKEEYSFTGRKGILDNGAEAARKYKAQRPKLTEEERAAALAAMTGNAALHDGHRSDRIKLAEEAIEREKAKAAEESANKDKELEFQSKLNKEAFMNSATSMAERLSQRKHYRERLGDE